MLKVNIDIWILIICMAIPFLCLITIFFLIFKKKSKSLRTGNVSLDAKNTDDFKGQIALQVTCQHLNLLLLNTINELEKQRLFLQGYMTKKTPSHPFFSKKLNEFNDYTQQIYIKETEQNSSNDNNLKADGVGSVNDPISSYHMISELFQSGMTSKQIAEKIKIPQAEIDLYIKLHFKKDQDSGEPAPSLRVSV